MYQLRISVSAGIGETPIRNMTRVQEVSQW
jgi:hypothetical protein